MSILSLFKKPATVEEIHQEFDSAQERILSETDKILAELKIPTESKLESKAKALQQLGFVKSEPVRQYSFFETKQKEIKGKIEVTSKQANLIRELSLKYPNEKFITVKELERICDKYNLIHAPVGNYIKDVPEKNVQEMVNLKPLDKIYAAQSYSVLYVDRFWDNVPAELKKVFKNGLIVNENIDKTEYSFMQAARKHGGYNGNYRSYIYEIARIETIDKKGFYICAPPSHFDLKGVDKKSKYGFFTVTITEVKDPVVFEFCIDDIVRICTKWGCESDQAYLDPILQIPTNN